MRKMIVGVGAAMALSLTVLLSGCNLPLGASAESAAITQNQELRTIVYEAYGIQFLNPHDIRTVASGAKLKAASDATNIYLEDRKGRVIPVLGDKEREVFRERLEDLPTLSSVDLIWSSEPHPIDDGQYIVYNSNRSDLVLGSDSTSIHIITSDGDAERLLLDSERYGSVTLVDTVGTRIYAQGDKGSLVVVDVSTLEVKRYDLQGVLDAVSSDGQHVLYRKRVDGYVLPELYIFNLATTESQFAGDVPKEYTLGR